MSKAKILVVEDNAIIAFKLRYTLESLDYTVAAGSGSGEDAIEAALKNKPDLILMDINLKGEMDGIEATERIRAEMHVPVIFVTAYSDEAKIRRAKQTLPYGYLLKPVQDKELEIAVEIALHVARVGARQRFAESERQKLQQQLFQAQKMESLGTLAGGIAHDFNNLLFQIMGSIQLAEKRIGTDNPAVKNLSNALKATNRARELVEQILTFSRARSSGRIPLLPQPIIKEAIKLLRATLPSTIEFREEIDSFHSRIECDGTQLYQIMVNLCTNAHHAMSENGGRLTIKLKESLEVFESSEPGEPQDAVPCIELVVSDTGCGMEPGVVERIFDPYFTTKEVGEGTGLGLSIVHGIVTKHNGRIFVESTPGSGSTFRIVFPTVTEPERDETDDTEAETLVGGNECIMVIDDEELIVKMEQEVLESLGYRVEAFISSMEALAAYRRSPKRYQLILSDQTMPSMTGVELVRKILEINNEAKVILLTGFSDSISDEQARAIGVKRFLMKPLDINKMAKAVRSTLDKDQA